MRRFITAIAFILGVAIGTVAAPFLVPPAWAQMTDTEKEWRQRVSRLEYIVEDLINKQGLQFSDARVVINHNAAELDIYDNR